MSEYGKFKHDDKEVPPFIPYASVRTQEDVDKEDEERFANNPEGRKKEEPLQFDMEAFQAAQRRKIFQQYERHAAINPSYKRYIDRNFPIPNEGQLSLPDSKPSKPSQLYITNKTDDKKQGNHYRKLAPSNITTNPTNSLKQVRSHFHLGTPKGIKEMKSVADSIDLKPGQFLNSEGKIMKIGPDGKLFCELENLFKKLHIPSNSLIDSNGHTCHLDEDGEIYCNIVEEVSEDRLKELSRNGLTSENALVSQKDNGFLVQHLLSYKERTLLNSSSEIAPGHGEEETKENTIEGQDFRTAGQP